MFRYVDVFTHRDSMACDFLAAGDKVVFNSLKQSIMQWASLDVSPMDQYNLN